MLMRFMTAMREQRSRRVFYALLGDPVPKSAGPLQGGRV